MSHADGYGRQDSILGFSLSPASCALRGKEGPGNRSDGKEVKEPGCLPREREEQGNRNEWLLFK